MTFGYNQGFGGTAGGVGNLFTLTDTDEFVKDAVFNINDRATTKFANNKYGILRRKVNATGTEMDVFTVNSSGIVDSSSYVQTVDSVDPGTGFGADFVEEDKVIACWNTKVAIITTSGVTITVATPVSLASSQEGKPIALSTTKALIMLANGNFQIATITGTAISLSVEITASGYTINGNILDLGTFSYDEDHAIITGTNDGSVTQGYCLLLTIAHGVPSITQSSKVTLTNSGQTATDAASIAALTDTLFVCAVASHLRVVTRSGTTLSVPGSQFNIASFPAVIENGASQAIWFSNGADLTATKVNVTGAGAITTATTNATLTIDVASTPFSLGQAHKMTNGFINISYRSGSSVQSFRNPIRILQP